MVVAEVASAVETELQVDRGVVADGVDQPVQELLGKELLAALA